MSQTRLRRMRFFAYKKLTAVLHGLRPHAIAGRITGPKVLINSIPKAGTHLVESALDHFPLLRNAALPTLRGWDQVPDATMRALRRLKPGQYRTAHLPAHSKVLEAVVEHHIRVIFVVRDPRDIVLSNYKYATYIDGTHPTHGYLAGLPDDATRLLKTIVGEPGLLTPINDILDRFEGWLNCSHAKVIRFEDLVGSKGGGSDKRQREAITCMAGHIGIDLTSIDLDRIIANVFHPRSLTFRSGQIGKWKTAFSDLHVTTFKETAGHRPAQYGYGE